MEYAKRSEQVKNAADKIAETVKMKLFGYSPHEDWEHEQNISKIAEVHILRLLADL